MTPTWSLNALRLEAVPLRITHQSRGLIVNRQVQNAKSRNNKKKKIMSHSARPPLQHTLDRVRQRKTGAIRCHRRVVGTSNLKCKQTITPAVCHLISQKQSRALDGVGDGSPMGTSATMGGALTLLEYLPRISRVRQKNTKACSAVHSPADGPWFAGPTFPSAPNRNKK